ncbi:MAG: S8 family serine peptidase [Mycobacteriales bacterium]
MKRLGLVAVIALAVHVLFAGVPAVASWPPMDRATAGASVSQMHDVIVVLSSQADLRAVRGSSRAARLADLKRVLRAKADATQRSLLAFLRTRQSQHRADTIVPLWITNEIKVRATPDVIDELAARSDVKAIRTDATIAAPAAQAAATGPAGLSSAPAESNIDKVGAPAMWDLGYRGQGVVVANMDTGVDVSHPDLSSSWRGGSNSWYDPNGQHPTTPTDISGHGTETMGVMVGGDAGGTAVGVAPGASWIAVKIFNDKGVTQTSTIHQGFQWLLDPDGNPATADAPNVVNNSWSTAVAGCDLEFQQDLRGLRAVGIVPVFAAGNYGPLAGSTYGPAGLPEALAVGNVGSDDVIDPSSSRGPSGCSGAVSPKVVAPGVNIRSTELYGGYATASGTSLSAPHVAGALALLLSASPGLPADQQEAAIANGAADLGSPGVDNDYGYGRLDAVAAYNWARTAPGFTVSAAPSSVTVAPGGSASYTVSVGAVNGFTADVSLALSGLTATQAGWTFAPQIVQGGAGTSQLVVTTSGSIAPGSYPLTVSATSGTTTRTVPLTLVVPQPPDFTMSVSPVTVTVTRGNSGKFTISFAAVAGFVGNVTLSRSALPAGSTSTWSKNPVAVPGSSVLTVKTTSKSPRGSFSLTLTGVGGSRTRQVSVTLIIK